MESRYRLIPPDDKCGDYFLINEGYSGYTDLYYIARIIGGRKGKKNAEHLLKALKVFEEVKDIAQEFINRVDSGVVRSVYTYNRMKKLLSLMEEK